MEQKLDVALDLMRRLPPQNTEQNLARIVDLCPDICGDLLASVDQPLKVVRDDAEGKDFLICDYNRDGDSYRSPYTNQYFPPLDDGTLPSDRLRLVEQFANDAFDKYRELYYEGGLSSVYLWDMDNGFAGVFLFKKSAAHENDSGSGCWDSINLVEVQEKPNGRSAHYKLTTTVMLWLKSEEQGDNVSGINLGGNITRQIETDKEVGEGLGGHVKNIGEMIEEMETKVRAHLIEIYFGKTRTIVNGLRSYDLLSDEDAKRKMQSELVKNLANRQTSLTK